MQRRLPKVTHIKERKLAKILGKYIFYVSKAKIIQKQPSTISSDGLFLNNFSMYVGVKPVMFVKNANTDIDVNDI